MSYPNSLLRRPNPLIIIIDDLPRIPPTEIRRTTQQQLRNIAQVMSIPQPARKFRSYMRRVPLFGPLAVGALLVEWSHYLTSTPVWMPGPWQLMGNCAISEGTQYKLSIAGLPNAGLVEAGLQADSCLANQGVFGLSSYTWPTDGVRETNAGSIEVWEYQYGLPNNPRYRRSSVWARDKSETPAFVKFPHYETVEAPRHVPMLNAQPAPYATYYPPLANPPALAPWLKYGYGGERKTPLLPEDSEAGYHNEAIHQRTEPNPPWLMSEPPPAGTKEKKIRITDRALGALVQRVIGGSTEGLDFAWAFFNSLPMYLRYKAFNHFRRLEVRGNDGFIKEARLHYVALTPQEMIEWTLLHIDEMDPTNLLTNILAMQGSDRAWAAIGRAMGRYARGPWDQPLPGGPNATDWAPFVEFVTENYFHNEELLNDLARQYNLTREEMRIINNRFRQYREQNPGYEPPITL